MLRKYPFGTLRNFLRNHVSVTPHAQSVRKCPRPTFRNLLSSCRALLQQRVHCSESFIFRIVSAGLSAGLPQSFRRTFAQSFRRPCENPVPLGWASRKKCCDDPAPWVDMCRNWSDKPLVDRCPQRKRPKTFRRVSAGHPFPGPFQSCTDYYGPKLITRTFLFFWN